MKSLGSPSTMICFALLGPPLVVVEAGAAPLLVRAQTALSVSGQRLPTGLVLRGRLVDDQGRGMAGRSIAIRLLEGGSPAERVHRDTDAFGAWLWQPAAAPRSGRVEARFEGERLFGPSRGVARLPKLAEPLDLSVHGPAYVDQGRAGQADVRVLVRAAGEPLAGVRLLIRLDGRRLSGLAPVTESNGSVRLTLPERPAGPHLLSVLASGLQGHRAARAQLAYQVRSSPRLRAEASVGSGTLEERIRVRGTLTTGGEVEPRPVVGANLVLRSGGQRLVELRSGLAGEFEGEIGRGSLRAGAVVLELVFAGNEAIGPAQQRLKLQLAALRPPRSWPYLLPVALSLFLLVLGWLVLRLRSWWRLGSDERTPASDRGSSGTVACGDEGRPVSWWAELPPCQGDERLVVGSVVDSVLGTPLPGVVIGLFVGGAVADGDAGPLLAESDAEGRFRFNVRGVGDLRLEAALSCYQPCELRLGPRPEAGAPQLAELFMRPWRVAVRDAWNGFAAHSLGGKAPWGERTPAEVEAVVESNGELWSELTRLVERSWYGPEPTEEAVAQRVERLCGELDPGRPTSGLSAGESGP